MLYASTFYVYVYMFQVLGPPPPPHPPSWYPPNPPVGVGWGEKGGKGVAYAVWGIYNSWCI